VKAVFPLEAEWDARSNRLPVGLRMPSDKMKNTPTSDWTLPGLTSWPLDLSQVKQSENKAFLTSKRRC